MPLLSVLTAAHAGRPELLTAAGRSVAGQHLPSGWELEWIVQEDGPRPDLAERVLRFPFASHAALGDQLGIAMTRNLALNRARGQLVHVLDSDDVLLPHALGVAIAAFDARPRIHWVAAQADDLLPDAGRRPYRLRYRPGPVAAGELSAMVIADGEPPISCAGLTMRTGTVRALGGWVANPCSEDVALFAALAELTPGYITPEVTWLIRHHSQRTSLTPAWGGLRAGSVAMVRQRIAALRETGIRLDP